MTRLSRQSRLRSCATFSGATMFVSLRSFIPGAGTLIPLPHCPFPRDTALPFSTTSRSSSKALRAPQHRLLLSALYPPLSLASFPLAHAAAGPVSRGRFCELKECAPASARRSGVGAHFALPPRRKQRALPLSEFDLTVHVSAETAREHRLVSEGIQGIAGSFQLKRCACAELCGRQRAGGAGVVS